MIRSTALASSLVLAAVALGGCVQAQANLQPDFSASLRQDIAAQIADPAPHYKRVEQPASSGPRTALAQDRYNKGKVIQPAATNTSNAVVGAAAGGGGEGKQ